MAGALEFLPSGLAGHQDSGRHTQRHQQAWSNLSVFSRLPAQRRRRRRSHRAHAGHETNSQSLNRNGVSCETQPSDLQQ